jgi:hypothetical protein
MLSLNFYLFSISIQLLEYIRDQLLSLILHMLLYTIQIHMMKALFYLLLMYMKILSYLRQGMYLVCIRYYQMNFK